MTDNNINEEIQKFIRNSLPDNNKFRNFMLNDFNIDSEKWSVACKLYSKEVSKILSDFLSTNNSLGSLSIDMSQEIRKRGVANLMLDHEKDFLLLSRRIANLSSESDFLDRIVFLNLAFELWPQKCLTPSKKLKLFEKIKKYVVKADIDFAQKLASLGYSGMPRTKIEQDSLDNVLIYLSSNQMQEDISRHINNADSVNDKKISLRKKKM